MKLVEYPKTTTSLAKPPSTIEHFALKRILGALRVGLQHGRLNIHLPDGKLHTFGKTKADKAIDLYVHRYTLFKKILFKGATGLGEAYVDGDFECTNLTGFIALLCKNHATLEHTNRYLSFAVQTLNRLRHRCRRNNRSMSRRNIQEHYDLSNAFFSTFLDTSMTYSCAIFKNASDSLETAQRRKLETVIDKAQIKPHHHILEIGSGWGSFAIQAAQQTGCRVTTLTLSQKQQKLTLEKIEAAGLSERIKVLLRDYRDIRGRYDRIVSIEMLEAVGHAYLGTFFERCDALLKPGGRAVLQVITIPDQYYDAYRHGEDWIRKYIFPGGHLPSLLALNKVLKTHTRFSIEHLENIGIHYTRTLREWHSKFNQHIEDVRKLGFSHSFERKWRYYLNFCEASFATRMLNNLQLVLCCPQQTNASLQSFP